LEIIVSQEEKNQSSASGGYRTPVEEDIRKTGNAAQTDAKPSAVPESGSSDQITEGAGNQGTEKR
jgi:photosystem I subunit 4